MDIYRNITFIVFITEIFGKYITVAHSKSCFISKMISYVSFDSPSWDN